MEEKDRPCSDEKGLTKESCIKLFNSTFWNDMETRDIAMFQLFNDRLCMPFDVFHKALEDTLGRPVFTHELGSSNVENIREEFRGNKPTPSFADIVDLIPEDKRIIAVLI